MNEIKKAQMLFDEGHACSQSILTAFAGRYNLSSEMALRLAGSFGGGMGRQGMTCGAVTGALMVLGLHAGRLDPDDESSRDRNDALVQEFFRRFRDKFNTLDCNELTGLEMSCPAARDQGNKDGTFEKICPEIVCFAAEQVTELLEWESE